MSPTRDQITSMRMWRDKKHNWHRSTGPAIEWDDGTKWWYSHGMCRQSEYGHRSRKEEHPACGMPARG